MVFIVVKAVKVSSSEPSAKISRTRVVTRATASSTSVNETGASIVAT